MAKRNGSIDIFRYVCAVMVVAIHTSPFYDINEHIGRIFSEVLTRIAVPFFFVSSGYFYFHKLNNGASPFKGYLSRTVKTYFIWSCLYFALDFLQWGHTNLLGFLIHCGYSFFIIGSHFHFWFFPALIVSLILVTLGYSLKLQKLLLPTTMILYIIGCLGCSYSTLGDTIPGLSLLYKLESFFVVRRIFLMGLPYFVAGLTVEWIKKQSEKRGTTLKRHMLQLTIMIGLYILEVALVFSQNLGDNIIITFGLYPITVYVFAILLMFPGKYGGFTAQCQKNAEWTYYLHPIVVLGLKYIGSGLELEIEGTFLFFLTIIVTLIIRYLFDFANKKMHSKESTKME